ncbi:hypothetical protein TNCV_727951 [Trichonephila clavipes]|nr:hypothetical protein TNCV_727951 [Trichonephila clavipes]
MGSLWPKKANSYQPNPEAKRDHAKALNIYTTCSARHIARRSKTPHRHTANAALCKRVEIQDELPNRWDEMKTHLQVHFANEIGMAIGSLLSHRPVYTFAVVRKAVVVPAANLK